MVISSALKINRYGIRYWPGNQRINGWMKSQKENKIVRSNLVFLPLDWTFKIGSYINSNQSEEDENILTPLLALTINVITKDEEMVRSPTVYPCSLNFGLNNLS